MIKDDSKVIREKGYERLVTWQIADDLAWRVYRLTDKFPRDELFGITSQLRRAVLSIPLNIVEGYARNNKNEFRVFLRISLGSLAETDYLLRFSCKRNYISKFEFEIVHVCSEECGRVLWRLMKAQ